MNPTTEISSAGPSTPVVLSAVVVHWHNEEEMAELSRAWPVDPRCELLVVDNSSSLGELPGVRVLDPGVNLGFGGGVNHGTQAACGAWILVLNPDLRPEEGAVDALLTTLGDGVSVRHGTPSRTDPGIHPEEGAVDALLTTLGDGVSVRHGTPSRKGPGIRPEKGEVDALLTTLGDGVLVRPDMPSRTSAELASLKQLAPPGGHVGTDQDTEREVAGRGQERSDEDPGKKDATQDRTGGDSEREVAGRRTPGAQDRTDDDAERSERGFSVEGEARFAGLVPALVDEDGRPQTRWQLRPLPSAVDLLLHTLFMPGPQGPRREPERGTPIGQPAGAALVIRRSVLEEIGGFDEAFFPAWFEDVDLAKKLASRGYELLYEPRARFRHAIGGSLPALGYGPFLWIYYKNLCRYLRRHHGAFWALLARWMLPLGMTLRLLLLGLRRPRRARTRRAAAAGLMAVIAGAWSGFRWPGGYAERFKPPPGLQRRGA